MLDTGPLIALLNSESIRALVAASVISIDPPASPSQIECVRKQLPAGVFREILPLLQVTRGFEVRDPSAPEGSPCTLGADLTDFKTVVWPSTYPIAAEMGIFEELLYWDLSDEHCGEVFFVQHDPPLHCLAFRGLHDALSFFLTRSADSAWRDLDSMPILRPSWPTVGEFVGDSDELREFLRSFPPYYTVHDLRTAGIGEAFRYNATGPDGFVRWRGERLFIQRQPKHWFEALRWLLRLPAREGRLADR